MSPSVRGPPPPPPAPPPPPPPPPPPHPPPSPTGFPGRGELVVVDASLGHPEAGQRGDGRVHHGRGPADIAVRAFQTRLVPGHHIRDEPDLAVPAVLFGRLGQRRDVAKSGQ